MCEWRPLAEERLQIQPPGFQQRGHLDPRFVHPPPVNPLYRRALENHVVHQIERHILGGNPEQRRAPSRPQGLETLLNRHGIPAHFEQGIHSGAARFAENPLYRVFRRRINHHVRTHFVGHGAPCLVRLRRKYGRTSAGFRHRNRHQSNRPASRHQNGLPRNRPGEHRVHGVPQRIENRPVVLGNARIELDDV